jgi:hypothetical protein
MLGVVVPPVEVGVVVVYVGREVGVVAEGFAFLDEFFGSYIPTLWNLI